MFGSKNYLLALLACSLLAASSVKAERIWFPKDAGVVDVTKPPYSATPDDGVDDTAAIQQALNDHPSGNHIFYFPDGVYDLSDELMRRAKDDPLRTQHACLELRGSMKRNIFVGESRSGTVLRLMDSVPKGFQGALIWFGARPAQRFRNAIRHLTLSIGVGHPVASGVLFNASNQGGLRNVRIISEDPDLVGAVGLHLAHTDEIGPMLVQDVTIIGFDRGIRCAFQTASQTFENITLEGQREYGLTNGFSQSVFIRGLHFKGSTTAVRSGPTVPGDPGQAKLLLIDSELNCSAGGRHPVAVRNQKVAFLRSIQADGFRAVVSRELDHGRGNPSKQESPLEEFIANGANPGRKGPPFRLFDSPEVSLSLPIQERPEVKWEQDPLKWASPGQFQIGQSGRPDDEFDDTPSIQAAIDSNATTVYLPRGTWRIKGELILRSHVRHFVGCESRLNPVPDERTARVTLSDGHSPIVLAEGLEAGGIVFSHRSDRTLHLRHFLGCRYETPVEGPAGSVFLTDVVSGPIAIGPAQSLWARQLNIEGSTEGNENVGEENAEAKLLNRGGTAWVLGMKTEDAGTVIKTVDGGSTELLGHLHVGHRGDSPCFVTIDSRFSAAVTSAPSFSIAAVETRGGETRSTADFRMADLYVAYPRQAHSLSLDPENE